MPTTPLGVIASLLHKVMLLICILVLDIIGLFYKLYTKIIETFFLHMMHKKKKNQTDEVKAILS